MSRGADQTHTVIIILMARAGFLTLKLSRNFPQAKVGLKKVSVKLFWNLCHLNELEPMLCSMSGRRPECLWTTQRFWGPTIEMECEKIEGATLRPLDWFRPDILPRPRQTWLQINLFLAYKPFKNIRRGYTEILINIFLTKIRQISGF